MGDDVVQLARDPRALAEDRRRARARRGCARSRRACSSRRRLSALRERSTRPASAGMPTGTIVTQAMPERGRRARPRSARSPCSRPTVADGADDEMARAARAARARRLPTTHRKTATARCRAGGRRATALERGKSTSKASRLRQRRAPREGQRHGGEDARRRAVTPRAPASSTSADLECAARARSSDRERGEHALGIERAPGRVDGSQTAHPADGRPAPAGCRRPQG